MAQKYICIHMNTFGLYFVVFLLSKIFPNSANASNTYYVYLHNFIGCQVRCEWGIWELMENKILWTKRHTVKRICRSTWTHLYPITCYFLHLISILCIVFIEIGYGIVRAVNTMKIELVSNTHNNLHYKWKKHGKGGTLRERKTGTTTTNSTMWWLHVAV